ncbi:unnamed protein product [Blepharisma stoltei]|uniref:Uncharacterized protein n=1 Tax=Blepharisma stoltei TaxID=1481888 RepID=A0AAU9J0V4_9CILI|nr:unnamed protein product [Blepharisma stoltei]
MQLKIQMIAHAHAMMAIIHLVANALNVQLHALNAHLLQFVQLARQMHQYRMVYVFAILAILWTLQTTV